MTRVPIGVYLGGGKKGGKVRGSLGSNVIPSNGVGIKRKGEGRAERKTREGRGERGNAAGDSNRKFGKGEVKSVVFAAGGVVCRAQRFEAVGVHSFLDEAAPPIDAAQVRAELDAALDARLGALRDDLLRALRRRRRGAKVGRGAKLGHKKRGKRTGTMKMDRYLDHSMAALGLDVNDPCMPHVLTV